MQFLGLDSDKRFASGHQVRVGLESGVRMRKVWLVSSIKLFECAHTFCGFQVNLSSRDSFLKRAKIHVTPRHSFLALIYQCASTDTSLHPLFSETFGGFLRTKVFYCLLRKALLSIFSRKSKINVNASRKNRQCRSSSRFPMRHWIMQRPTTLGQNLALPLVRIEGFEGRIM